MPWRKPEHSRLLHASEEAGATLAKVSHCFFHVSHAEFRWFFFRLQVWSFNDFEAVPQRGQDFFETALGGSADVLSAIPLQKLLQSVNLRALRSQFKLCVGKSLSNFGTSCSRYNWLMVSAQSESTWEHTLVQLLQT